MGDHTTLHGHYSLVSDVSRCLVTHCKIWVVHGPLSCAPCINQLCSSYTWKRPRGRPRHTWIRTVEDDLRPASVGLHIEHRTDLTGEHFVGTATLQ